MNRHTGGRLPSRPPRNLSPPPLAPRVSVALDNLFTAVAASKDSNCHGGGGVLVDLSTVATVATAVGRGVVDL
jgi:hypothetical protein